MKQISANRLGDGLLGIFMAVFVVNAAGASTAPVQTAVIPSAPGIQKICEKRESSFICGVT